MNWACTAWGWLGYDGDSGLWLCRSRYCMKLGKIYIYNGPLDRRLRSGQDTNRKTALSGTEVLWRRKLNYVGLISPLERPREEQNYRLFVLCGCTMC